MSEKNIEIIKDYLSQVSSSLGNLPVDKIIEVIEVLNKVCVNNKKVLIFGNGGSAATASHFASDLSKGAICEDKPRFKALALCDNTPLLSAWANDTDYGNIFSEQLENFADPGDVAIAISGSGNSMNILNGIKTARAKGATTVGFIGFDGGKLKHIVDIPVVVPNHNMEQVEDIHLMLEHIITTCLRLGTGDWGLEIRD